MTGTIRKIYPDSWFITGGSGFKFTLYHSTIDSIGIRKPAYYPLIEFEVLSLNNRINHLYDLLNVKDELTKINKKISIKHGAFEKSLEKYAQQIKNERKFKKQFTRTNSEKSFKKSLI